ncbi:MAG: hypothetical protein KAS32_21935 [Candidatus Peribacteraceae bacterium]|nr:hypothetical protein [Candidatus Peribacteraceae bacterium]
MILYFILFIWFVCGVVASGWYFADLMALSKSEQNLTAIISLLMVPFGLISLVVVIIMRFCDMTGSGWEFPRFKGIDVVHIYLQKRVQFRLKNIKWF